MTGTKAGQGNGVQRRIIESVPRPEGLNSVFVVDLEMWGYLKRMAAPSAATDETLALDTVAELPADYLATDHTMRHFREELLTPALAPALSYDAWRQQGPPDALAAARGRVAQLLAAVPPPPLPRPPRPAAGASP